MIRDDPDGGHSVCDVVLAGNLLPGDLIESENRTCYLVLSRVNEPENEADGWGPNPQRVVTLGLLRFGPPALSGPLGYDARVPLLNLSARRYASVQYRLVVSRPVQGGET